MLSLGADWIGTYGQWRRVTKATQADVEAIRELTRAAYAKWVPLMGREPKPMGADYEAALRKHRFDLLYDQNVLAGSIETVDQHNQLLY